MEEGYDAGGWGKVAPLGKALVVLLLCEGVVKVCSRVVVGCSTVGVISCDEVATVVVVVLVVVVVAVKKHARFLLYGIRVAVAVGTDSYNAACALCCDRRGVAGGQTRHSLDGV